MTAHSNTAIQINGVSKSFNDAPVLKSISFSIGYGEIVGLFGPSGCGKSTLLRILCDILPQDTGIVSLFGRSIRAQKTPVAYVPQRGELLEWKGLWENALLGWRITQRCDPPQPLVEHAKALFARFGLTA